MEKRAFVSWQREKLLQISAKNGHLSHRGFAKPSPSRAISVAPVSPLLLPG